MRTVVYNQGYNRVEHYQIICLERAKLNRLLDEERRFTENLIDLARREIETRPQITPTFEALWNKIQNHSFVRDICRRIDCLTDAYPQFTQQVVNARARLREKAIAALEAVRFSAQRAVNQNRLTKPALCLVIK